MKAPIGNILFPHDPLLVKLLDAAKRVPSSRVMIEDMYGLRKTYPELLADIVHTKNQFAAALSPRCFNDAGLLVDEFLYQAACTKTGYEFAVAFFAVRALGGAFLPLGMTSAMSIGCNKFY